jgi:hypothetical protein
MRLSDMHSWKWRKLKRVLERYAERPELICFNCGTAMYPTEASVVTITGLEKKEFCRAYVTYEKQIRELAQQRRVDEFSVFHCSPCDAPKGARAAGHKAPYFKVHACKHSIKVTKSPTHDGLYVHQPEAMNLHDGWEPYEHQRHDIGLGDDLLPAIASLSPTDCMDLALLKMPCSLFRGYNDKDYNKFAGGAYLAPDDFIGTFVVCAREPKIAPTSRAHTFCVARAGARRGCADRTRPELLLAPPAA